jgi:ketosteroid isomerase-like protein
MKDAVARIEVFFAALGPSDLTRLGDFYTPDAYFKDPFNEVRGVAAIEGIFRHMFDALDTPRFVITSRVVDGDQCFLVWEFRFAFKNFHKGEQQVVHGGSHLVLAPDGRIQSHRDYWDAAEELYEKLPLVGSLMRWLKRRSNS